MNTPSYIQVPSISDLPNTAIVTPSSFFSQVIRREISRRAEIRQRCLIHDSVPLYQSENLCVLGPLLGAPASMSCAETLARSGVTRMLVFGFAGGISFHQQAPQAGDCILANSAICETGVNELYGYDDEIANPESSFLASVRSAISPLEGEKRVIEGRVWSTSAPFRESVAKAKRFAARGAVGVDMEFAPLLGFSLANNIDLVGVFIVSDLLGVRHESCFSSVKRSGLIENLSDALVSTLC